MVHRIHNRNPGYSDFSNISASTSSLNISTSSPISEGATALKLENEVTEQPSSEITNFNETVENAIVNSINEESLTENNIDNENSEIIEANDIEKSNSNSNGLENFGIEEETPELFSSEESTEISDQEFTSFEDTKEEEDELEIPAFLRRQKN